MGLLFIPINTTAFNTLPPELRTEGSSLLNLSRSLGASIGIAVTTALLARNLQTSHSDLAAHVTASMTSLIDLSTTDRFQQIGTTVITMVDAEVNRQAAMIAYIDNYYMMMWLSLIVMPLALLMRRPAKVELLKGDAPH
jgi:DHA2 family multidrug resistance protein